jgi:hypothetical protein
VRQLSRTISKERSPRILRRKPFLPDDRNAQEKYYASRASVH